MSRRLRWPLAAIVFTVSFAVRFLNPSFTNDHFQWISGGRQILVYGEAPYRDFYDPGYFLQNYASAGALLLFGDNLLGEALLSISLLSAGITLTFWLATQASRSLLIGSLAATAVFLMFPRLYNYPKIFLYVFSFLACWRYVDCRTTGRLVVVALVTALAFLFRHDHGIYVAVGAVVTLIATHWQDGPRPLLARLALYGVVGVVAVLPFFVFVEMNGGILSYFGSGVEFSSNDAVRTQPGRTPPFVFDRSAPLFRIEPPPPSTGPLPRVSIAPGVFHAANAVFWLYVLFLTLPVATLAVLAAKRARWRSATERLAQETPKLLGAAALCAVAAPVLLRDPFGARLADVAAPSLVLAAWLLGQMVGVGLGPVRLWKGRPVHRTDRSDRPRSPLSVVPSALRPTTALILVGLTFWSIATLAQPGQALRRTGILGGPGAIRHRAVETFQELRDARGNESWAPSNSTPLVDLATWARACTNPTDRAMMTWFAPEFYFFARRGFTAGQIVPNRHRTLQSIFEEPAPIVIAQVGSYDNFERSFPRVAEHFAQHYTVVAESNFGKDVIYRVMVDRRRRPSGTYRAWSLPCYQ